MKTPIEMLPRYSGKLTANKVNDKLKQNVWIGWMLYFSDGSDKLIETGTFKTLKLLKVQLHGGEYLYEANNLK